MSCVPGNEDCKCSSIYVLKKSVMVSRHISRHLYSSLPLHCNQFNLLMLSWSLDLWVVKWRCLSYRVFKKNYNGSIITNLISLEISGKDFEHHPCIILVGIVFSFLLAFF